MPTTEYNYPFKFDIKEILHYLMYIILGEVYGRRV